MLILSSETPARPTAPTVTYEARSMPRRRKAFVELHDSGEIRMVCTRWELDPDGARVLTRVTRDNILKHNWMHHPSGLLLDEDAHQPAAEPQPTIPTIVFEVDDLDPSRPAFIIEGKDFLYAVVDEDLCGFRGAGYMTDAVQEYVADGAWSRSDSGLWLP